MRCRRELVAPLGPVAKVVAPTTLTQNGAGSDVYVLTHTPSTHIVL